MANLVVILALMVGWGLTLLLADRATRRKDLFIRSLLQERFKPHEPTAFEVGLWAKANGKWVGTPDEIIRNLAANGWVILSADAWRELAQVLERIRQPTVQEWMERD